MEDIFDVQNSNQLMGGKGKMKSERGPSAVGERNTDPDEGRIELTQMQEMYCKCRADGFNKLRSYKIAFPDCVSGHSPSATKLENQDKIKYRIEQLREERAWAAKLVDPQESLIRWNEIYIEAKQDGDKKLMVEAQKQIDKINGAEAAVIRQQLEVKGLFRGDSEEEWRNNAEKLLRMLAPNVEIMSKRTP